MYSTDSNAEIELKLLVPARALRRLSIHPLLKGRGRAVSKKLYSVYFDTPDLDLWRQGVALRVRREGRRWLQTVKGGGDVQGGLHRRLEFEVAVAGPFPDHAAAGRSAFSSVFESPQLRARLRPVFVTEFSRTARVLAPRPGLVIEACVDRGSIRSGERSEELCELEMELKSGQVSQLFEFAQALLDDFPLRVENRSKAERGYALFRNERAAPVKARAATLEAGMSVSEAFKAIMQATHGHLQANEHGVREGGDPEYLHQMRVALRRLRSAFSVFADVLPPGAAAPHVAGVKWLAGALGPARDWDVFMTETLPPIRRDFGAHQGLAAFERQCALVRQAAQRAAQRAVNSRRYQKTMHGLAAWLCTEGWAAGVADGELAALRAPVRGFADAVLSRRAARVAKHGRKLAQLTDAELHRLRISIKKLRYAADFFASLYEDAGRRDFLAQLARLQDILGAINDAAAVAGLIEQGFGARPGRAVVEARGIMLGWSRGRSAALRRELRTAWKAYRASQKFW